MLLTESVCLMDECRGYRGSIQNERWWNGWILILYVCVEVIAVLRHNLRTFFISHVTCGTSLIIEPRSGTSVEWAMVWCLCWASQLCRNVAVAGGFSWFVDVHSLLCLRFCVGSCIHMVKYRKIDHMFSTLKKKKNASPCTLSQIEFRPESNLPPHEICIF